MKAREPNNATVRNRHNLDTPARLGARHAARRRAGLVLLLADLIVTPSAMAAAMMIRYGFAPPIRHVDAFLTFLPYIAVLRVIVGVLSGANDFRHRLTLGDHGFGGAGTALLAVIATYFSLLAAKVYFDPAIEFSRAVAVIDFILLTLWYLCSRGAVLRWLRWRGVSVRTRLIGPPDACAALEREMKLYGPALLEIESTATNGQEFASVEQVVLVESDLPPDSLRDIVRNCELSRMEMYLHPSTGLSLLGATNVTNIAGVPLVPLGAPISFARYRFVKRAMDVAAAVLALPFVIVAILLAQLLVGAAAVYRQERVGLRGERFVLLKLRTMVDGAEDASGPIRATEDDARITPFGRWLRKSRMDELPQLWNVLRGDMSLVGPRPERPTFHDEYDREFPLYAQRLTVRPGLTGLAQIHGRYDTSAEQKLRYDLIYINSIGLLTDLRILLATVRVVLTGKGAR